MADGDLQRVLRKNLAIDYAPKMSFGPFDLDLSQYASSTRLKIVKDLSVGKEPFAKVYIPCSCIPKTKVALDMLTHRQTPWGLSMDAMRRGGRVYHDRLRPYRIQSCEYSCVGAVWTVLKIGLADVIMSAPQGHRAVWDGKSKLKKTGFVPRATGHNRALKAAIHNKTAMKIGKLMKCVDHAEPFIVPSDVIDAGKRLSNSIWKLDRQQLYLDAMAYSQRAGLSSLLVQHDLMGFKWHNCFKWLGSCKEDTIWRRLSAKKSRRSPGKRKIDNLMHAFIKNEDRIASVFASRKGSGLHFDAEHPWPMETGLLFRLEAAWEGLYTRSIKAAIKKLPDQWKKYEEYSQEQMLDHRIYLNETQLEQEYDEVLAQYMMLNAKSSLTGEQKIQLREIIKSLKEVGNKLIQSREFKSQVVEPLQRQHQDLKKFEESIAVKVIKDTKDPKKMAPKIEAKRLAHYENELARYESIRRSRAKLLIEIHQAIFDYISKKRLRIGQQISDQRILGTLLLGQMVAWRYSEVTHDNLSLEITQTGNTPEGFVIDGCYLDVWLKDYELGDTYPHLDISNQ